MLKVSVSEKKNEAAKISYRNYQLISTFYLCKSLTQRRKSGDFFFVCLQGVKPQPGTRSRCVQTETSREIALRVDAIVSIQLSVLLFSALIFASLFSPSCKVNMKTNI